MGDKQQNAEESNNQEERTEDASVVEEQSTDSAEETTTASSVDNKKLLVALVVVVVLIVGALELSGTTSMFGSKAVAVVNGEKISQADFDARVNQIFASDQAQFFNLEDPALRASIEEQILNEIINTRLLIQRANEAGFNATDAEVETEYQLILDRLGSELNTEEEKTELLAEELARNSLTNAEFRDNIRDQLIIEQFLTSQIDETLLVATEEEIRLFHEQLDASQQGVPALVEIRAEIESQIISQKRQQAVGDIILSLRDEADIVVVE